MINVLRKSKKKREHPWPDKGIYETPTANIMLNRKRLTIFLQSLGTRQGYLLPLLLSNIVPEGIVKAIRQKQEIRGIQIEK